MTTAVQRSPSSARVCYLSVDGMTDPLGRSQVLPYLTALARRGHDITLISLEKPDRFATERARVRDLCASAGIQWNPLPYRRRPPILAGRWNVARLGSKAWSLHRRQPFDVVHARSDLASLAGQRLWQKGGAKFLYDMRSLWPDERVEGGAWPQHQWLYRAIFRMFKKHQRRFLDEADAIVTLTRRGKEIVEQWPGRTGNAPITVIPCCADFDHFVPPTQESRQTARASLGIADEAPVLSYVGSVGSWYMLPEMLAFFAAYRARHADALLLFVTPDDESIIRQAASKAGVEDSLVVRSARREEMPELIGAADVGLFFIMPVFSKQASSPTKMGELLACGLPLVCNEGVGDVGTIVREIGGGVLVDRFDVQAFTAAVDELDRLTFDPAEIRQKARAWFDVDNGVEAYDGIYQALLREE